MADSVKHRVLVVDDESHILRAVEDVLGEDFQVVTEISPKAALNRLAADRSFSVIVSDQRMPEMGGDEFLAKALELSDAARILSTGYADIDAVIRAVNNSKIYGYVIKPWDEGQLRIIVARAAESYHLTRALRESEQRFRAIFEQAAVGIAQLDTDGRILRANEKLSVITGCPVQALTGRPLENVVEPREAGALNSGLARLMRGAQRNWMCEMDCRRAGDGAQWVGLTISNVIDGNGALLYLIAVVEDVTVRKHAERALEQSYEELRELSNAMNDVREAERSRIARELHDELAQLLTTLKMDLSWLSSRLSTNQRNLLERGEKMKALVDTTVTSVRRIAADLRPVMLDDLGLVPSIEYLLQSLSERANLAVDLSVNVDTAYFREPFATSIYRVIQEALTNVARHAQATNVEVVLMKTNDALLVRVTDDGIGLTSGLPGKKTYGLLGIRERAQMLGGEVRIYPPATGGTVVEVSVPLSRLAPTDMVSA